MEHIERLQKRWSDRERFRAIRPVMSLEKEGLVLGADTLLARRTHDDALRLEGNETRIFALLAVAYGRPVDKSVLGAIRSASKHARLGNTPLAAMHIALAKLPRMSDPIDAARRLFIANGLIEAGVEPRDIWTALEFDSSEFDNVEKGYDPDELRNPKGEGALSGRWTSIVEAGAEAAEGIEAGAARAVRALSLLNPVLDAANIVVAATSQGAPATRRGDVPGHPDLQYSFNEDDLSLNIYRPPFSIPIVQGHFGQNSTFMDRRDRKIARLTETGLRFFAQALSESIRDADTLQICPKPAPDHPGARELDLDYEDFIKEQNNTPPTPRGYAYWLLNPIDKRPVVIDECRESTNTPIEIKRGYRKMTSSLWGRAATGIDWGYQATRQTEAWGGPEIEWDFSDKQAADWAQEVFSRMFWLNERVRVKWKPWTRNDAGK